MSDDERVLAVEIDGIADGELLLLEAFSGEEALSRTTSFTLELASIEPDKVRAELPTLLGRHATIKLGPPDARQYFHGFITNIAQTGYRARHAHYEAELVPWLWFLERRTNCRIFQFADVKTILATILDEWMKTLKDDRLSYEDLSAGPHHVRDYCVQYRESDLAFISRLMEEEGMTYFFRHDENGHSLIITDDPAQHEDHKLPEALGFRLSTGRAEDAPSISGWTMEQQLDSGAYQLRDFHFEKAPSVQKAGETSLVPPTESHLEIYDYPGGFAKRFTGKDTEGSQRLGKGEMDELAKRQALLGMEEIETSAATVRGASSARQLRAGHLLEVKAEAGDLADEFYGSVDGSYLVTAVRHHASGGAHSETGGFAYDNTFDLLPQNVPFVENTLKLRQPIPFRPPRVTPKPEMRGPQTGIVVGPQQEEIHTDKYGRVKVQFFWDRRDKFNEESSCWIRVAQPWAGKRWGATFIPRIGQEVIVDFIDGDPDRPIITGSVYNAEQMPPYLGDGPDGDHKNDPRISGIKTNSTPGGKGFNELRFDDTDGKEQVFIHAQRSMDQRVRGSHRHTVGGSYHVDIGYEDKEGEKHGDLRVKVKKNHDLHVETDQRVKIDGKRSVEVHGDCHQMFFTHLCEAIQDEWTVECPKIIFKATDAICFEVSSPAGTNTIVIDTGGVWINGAAGGVAVEGTPQVKINCMTPIMAPTATSGPPDPDPPEDPAGADTAKSGFVSNSNKDGER